VQRRRGDFLQNPQGLNLQWRKNTKYTFAPANRSDSAQLSGTQPIVEEIIKGKDRKKKVTCITVFLQCWSTLGKHLKNTSQKVMIMGMKKVCKDKAFWGAAFVFFLPETRRFFPASRSLSEWNGGLSCKVIS
jgi:hypothetical protein